MGFSEADQRLLEQVLEEWFSTGEITHLCRELSIFANSQKIVVDANGEHHMLMR